MDDNIEIQEARPEDAAEIAEIHLAARRHAMPYLRLAFTADETRAWFADAVGDRPLAWWVAGQGRRVFGYMLLDGETLDQLYVHPSWQRRGIGKSLLTKAKAVSPLRLALTTFQRNAVARAFYEAEGFRVVGSTAGCNEENEPDVQYVWVARSC